MAPTTVTIVGQLVKMAEPTEPTAFASFQRRSRRALLNGMMPVPVLGKSTGAAPKLIEHQD